MFAIACLSFSYKAPVDHFEVSDPVDELAALGTVDVGTELEAQSLSQVVVLASEPFDLRLGYSEIHSEACRCGATFSSLDAVGLSLTGRLHMLANSACVNEPG